MANAVALINADRHKSIKKKSAWTNPRVILILLVAVLILYLTVGVDLMHKYSSLESQTASMVNKTNALLVQNQQAQAVVHNPAGWDKALSSVTTALPPGRSFPALIKQIAAVAASTGVSWRQGSTVASFSAPAGAPPSSFSLSITVDGTIPQVQSFIDNLQNINRLVSVSSFTISTYQSSPGVVSGLSPVVIQLNVWSWGGPTGSIYPPSVVNNKTIPFSRTIP